MMRRDQIAVILAAVAIFAAPLMIGGAPRWAALIASFLGIATAIPYLNSTRMSTKVSPLLVLLGIATGLTALQILPLPAELVKLLSPGKYSLVADNAAALGIDPPRFVALSYDPPATLVELAKLAGYSVFAYTCLRLSASSRGRRLLVTAVGACATIIAATALIHAGVGAEKLFGLYEPRDVHPVLLAPFLNVNHLAGFLAMAVPVLLGLAIASNGPKRLGWISAAALCAGTSLLANSRAAAIALTVGVVVAVALFLLQRRRTTNHRERPAPLAVSISIGVVGLCAIILIGTFTAGRVSGELRDLDPAAEVEHGKFFPWRSSFSLLVDNLWAGSGRGAFEYAYTRVNPTGDHTYSHLENEYLQAAVDWGVLGAGVLAIALSLVAIAAFRGWRTGPLEAGIIGGIVAIGVHNAADFNLQMPGVVLPTLALLATLLPLKFTRRPERRPRDRALRAGAIAGATIACVLAMTPLGRDAHADATRLQSLLAPGDQADSGDAVDLGQDLLQRHPSDYHVASLTAQAMFWRRDARAVRVVNRALYLSPRHGALHHLAARMLLASRTPSQALVEYALALRYRPNNQSAIVSELLQYFPDQKDVLAGLPDDSRQARSLATLLDRAGHGEIALAYLQRELAAEPNNPELLALTARQLLQQNDPASALELARRAHSIEPTPRSALLVARVSARTGNLEDAVLVLEQSIRTERQRSGDVFDLELALASTQYDLGHYHSAKETLASALGSLSGGDRRREASVHRALAKVENALGNTHQAQWELGKAKELLSN